MVSREAGLGTPLKVSLAEALSRHSWYESAFDTPICLASGSELGVLWMVRGTVSEECDLSSVTARSFFFTFASAGVADQIWYAGPGLGGRGAMYWAGDGAMGAGEMGG